MTGHKAAQADATNIDKGLTLSLREKESGYEHVYICTPHWGSSPFDHQHEHPWRRRR
jgi:hypothetical protein